MSADTAPAAMPGESLDELIDRARVAMAVYGDDGDFYGSEIIGDLIQALAEKERRIANLTRGLEEASETNVKLGMTWQAAAEKAEARALAAEADLAAERERCAKIAEKTGFRTISADIAAAIRAQGE